MVASVPVRGEGEHIEFFNQAKVPVLSLTPDSPDSNEVLVYCKIKDGLPVFYFQNDAGSEKELGPGAILNLSDSPSTYVGQAKRHVRVNSAEDSIEFVIHNGSGDPHEQYALDVELPHDKGLHSSAAIPGTHDEDLGPRYLEIDERAGPGAPGAGKRRIFVSSKLLYGVNEFGDAIKLDRPEPIITFAFPRKRAALEVFLPRPSFIVTANIEGPNVFNHQQFITTANVAGGAGGGNTVVLESTTGNPFTSSPSWTLRATATLGTGKIDTVTLGGSWVFNPITEYLRVRMDTIDVAQPPEDLMAYFTWDFLRT